MNMVKWLEIWYKSNCNGDWEHSYKNISIRTLDNPGWSVEINLIETPLEGKNLERIQIDNSDNDWLTCFVKQGKFYGVGDAEKLSTILEIFRKWSESEG